MPHTTGLIFGHVLASSRRSNFLRSDVLLDVCLKSPTSVQLTPESDRPCCCVLDFLAGCRVLIGGGYMLAPAQPLGNGGEDLAGMPMDHQDAPLFQR